LTVNDSRSTARTSRLPEVNAGQLNDGIMQGNMRRKEFEPPANWLLDRRFPTLA
jgi:hypothetical protein